MVGKPVNPKCGLLVECVGNRHDDTKLGSSKHYVTHYNINRGLIIRWTPDNYISGIFGVRTKKVWWGNQGILGVGNRHDNNETVHHHYF